MSEANLRITRSRERLQRYLARQDNARSEAQQRARQRRTRWTLWAVGLTVAGLVWAKPWRRAKGLASALAWVGTAAQASGMLATLAGTITRWTREWQTAQATPAGEARPGDDAQTRPGTAGPPSQPPAG